MAYPDDIDSFPDQETLAEHSLADDPHSQLHADLGAAIVAIQGSVGVVDSVDTATIRGVLNVPGGDLAGNPLSAAAVKAGAISTTKLADNAVNSAKLANGAVGTTQLADGAVTSAKIADGTVATGDLADGAVTTAKITDGNVTNAKLASNAVTTAKITDANVTTAKIADANVTLAKVAAEAWTAWTPTVGGGWLKGNGTTAGQYVKIGRTVFIKGSFTVGSTSTIGAGLTIGGMPYAVANRTMLGTAVAYDSSAGTYYTGLWIVAAGASSGGLKTNGLFSAPGSIFLATVDSNTPLLFASGDVVEFEGFYETAS